MKAKVCDILDISLFKIYMALFYFFKFICLFSDFWLCWVFVAARQFSLVAMNGGCLPAVVHRLRIAVASLVVVHGLQSAGSVVVPHQLTCPAAGGLLLPRPGIKPMAPELAGRFLTTEPPGKCLLDIS